MNKFKAGDWVRDTRQGMKKPIAQLKPNCIALTNPEEYAAHYIPWVPEVGEWCWFKDEKNTIGSLTQLVGIEEDGTYYGYSSCGIPDKAPCVEPFIGELPTFLQH